MFICNFDKHFLKYPDIHRMMPATKYYNNLPLLQKCFFSHCWHDKLYFLEFVIYTHKYAFYTNFKMSSCIIFTLTIFADVCSCRFHRFRCIHCAHLLYTHTVLYIKISKLQLVVVESKLKKYRFRYFLLWILFIFYLTIF